MKGTHPGTQPDSLGQTPGGLFPSCLGELVHPPFLTCQQGVNSPFAVGLL